MMDITIYKVKHGGDTEGETLSEAKKLLPYVKNSDLFSLEMTEHSQDEASQIARSWSGVLQNPNANRTNVRLMMEGNLRRDLLASSNGSDGLYMLTLIDYMFRSKVGLWLAERFSDREEGMRVYNGFALVNSEFKKTMLKVKTREPGSERELYGIDRRRYTFIDTRDRLIARLAQDREDFIKETHPWLAKKEVIRYGIPIGAFHEPERYLPGAKVVSLVDNNNLSEHTRLCGEMRDHAKKGTPLEEVFDLVRAVADSALMR